MLLKEVNKKRFTPKQVVEIMQAEGYPAFTQHYHTQLWKSLDAKDPAKGFVPGIIRERGFGLMRGLPVYGRTAKSRATNTSDDCRSGSSCVASIRFAGDSNASRFLQILLLSCLQCSEPEQIGYSELTNEDKDEILPIIELSQIKYEASFEETVAVVSSMLQDRPFVLDLSKDRAPPAYVAKNNPDHARIAKIQAAQDAYNQALTSLLTPTDGSSTWRTLVANFPNAIPVVQFTDPETQTNQILRQAAQLSKVGYARLAVRITQETNEALFSVIGQIAAILDSASQLLIIIDCGQGRQRISERAEFAKLAIARIHEEMEPSQALVLTAVCLNDSYTSPPDGMLRLYESCSWHLWSQASEKFPFLFGDYGSNYRYKKTNTFMPGDWKAQVVYPMEEAWLVYKHPDAQDAQGWIEGAKAVLDSPSCDKKNECWGSELLAKAKSGNIDGVGSARFWHGAKINMHIHRQIRHAQAKFGGGDP